KYVASTEPTPAYSTEFRPQRGKIPSLALSTERRFSTSWKLSPNQNPLVPKRSSVDLVALTTTQYTGTRKYRATITRIAVTRMVVVGFRPASRAPVRDSAAARREAARRRPEAASASGRAVSWVGCEVVIGASPSRRRLPARSPRGGRRRPR